MDLSEPSLSGGIGAFPSRCGHWSSGQSSLCSKHSSAERSIPDVSESGPGPVGWWTLTHRHPRSLRGSDVRPS
jgi:hypothetical protein